MGKTKGRKGSSPARRTIASRACLAMGLLLAVTSTSSCGGRAGAQSPAQALATVGLAGGFITALRFDANPGTAINSAAIGFSSRPGQGAGGTTPLRDAEGRHSAAAVGAAGCGYESTPVYASRVDADSDGIPVTMTWKYDYSSEACNPSASGIKQTFKGEFEETDLDDAKKWLSGGYAMEWDYESTTHIPSFTSGSGQTYPSTDFSYEGKGNWSNKQSGASFVATGAYSGDVTWKQPTIGGTYTYEGSFKQVITPDSLDASSTWLKGKADFTGTWTYSGFVPFDEHHDRGSSSGGDERNVDITFKLTTKNLTYDNSCSRYWKGTFRFDVGNNHVFEYVYDCTTLKYYYDGKEYDPTAA
jgi:hypothetical protein